MSTFDWEDFLTHHRMFSSLDKGEITWLLREDVSTERAYHKDEVLLREGEWGDTVFLVGSGSVQIILEGKTEYDMALTTLRKGEFFGEMAIIEQRPRAATVKALEDCTLLEVKGLEFRKLLAEHTDIAFKMLLELSERMRRVNRTLAEKVQDVDEKLDRFRTELRAELRVVEASLKAAQAVFEQTKVRTDEVITHAENFQSSLKVFISAVVAIFSVAAMVLGWLGINSLKDITDIKGKVIDQATKVEESVRSITEDVQIAKSLASQLELLPEIQKITTDTIFANVSQALEKKNIAEASRWHEILLKLNDPILTSRFLGEIEAGLTRNTDPEFYERLLKQVITSVDTPKNTVTTYILLLSALVLNNKYDEKLFQETLMSCLKYSKQYTTQLGKEKMDFSALESLFGKQDSTKKAQFQKVKSCMPRI